MENLIHLLKSKFLPDKIIHNFRTVGYMEADILFIKNDHLIEFELKNTIADFKNDFIKPKHRLFARNHYCSHVDYKNDCLILHLPHQYYFLTTFKVNKSLIPSYSGHIQFMNDKLILFKKAPKLHCITIPNYFYGRLNERNMESIL